MGTPEGVRALLLERYARALDWAEGGPLEAGCHERLDAAGRFVLSTFGCSLGRSGADYFQSCPVALAHNRIGFSVGGVATRVCSLCGGDLSECDHMRGRSYLVPGGRTELGWCRVCLKRDDCEHLPGEVYRVGVVAIIKQMDVEEVSIVGRPAHPEARPTRIGVQHSELVSALGPSFQAGMRVDCHRCASPCEGLIQHEDVPHG